MTLNASLALLIARLEEFEGPPPLEELTNVLASVPLSLDVLREFVHFDNDGYKDNLVYSSSCFEVRCMCWKNGQRSSVHDHQGSGCVLRVMQGTLRNTDFKEEGRGVRPIASLDLPCGSVCARQDAQIHQIANLAGDGSDAVSLHVYSPPLGETNVFPISS